MPKPIHHIKRILSAPEYIKILSLRTIGNFLIISALFLIVKTFYNPVYEEIRYFFDRSSGKRYVTADIEEIKKIERQYAGGEEKGGLRNVLKDKNVQLLIPKDPNFSIVIPKIGANAGVVANVDSSNPKAYLNALKYGVAHAQGTAFPGEGGHMYFFAHSTDYIWNVSVYNAIFYLLYKLEPGDEINIFYQGRRFVYRVSETKIVGPDAVEYLTRQTDSELLTLQTCWPPGTTLQRLLVFAKPVVE